MLRAIAQARAVCSPQSGILSAIAMFHQLTEFMPLTNAVGCLEFGWNLWGYCYKHEREGYSLSFISMPTSPWMVNGGAAVGFLAIGLLFIAVGRWLKSTFWYLAGTLFCCFCLIQLYIAHRLIWALTHPPTVN